MVWQPDTPAGSDAGDPPARHPAYRPPYPPEAARPAGGPPGPWVTEPFPQPPAYPPGPPPARTWDEPPRGRNGPSVRLWLAVILALLGILGLVVSVTGVAAQVLPRRFTAAQQQRIMGWEVASRWRTWPAGKIFPATVSYQLPWQLFGSASGLTLSAHRVGIAPQSDCTAATDAALARTLDSRGCQAVLRATYTDSTGSFVATIGIVVTRGRAPSPSSSPPGGRGPSPGVKAVAFPGTLAARFGDRQRQTSGAVRYGPYLVLYTAGYTDARPRDHESSNPYASSEMNDLGTGLAHSVGAAIGAQPPVPRCPGAPGC